MVCGVLTGLVPGLHLNTFIPFLISTSSSAFIVGVVLSHSFFDFLPAMFLGVPEESTGLSILPAHKMILKGQGIKAFKLATIGGIFSTTFALLLLLSIGSLVSQALSTIFIQAMLLLALLLTARLSPSMFFLSCAFGFVLFNSSMPSNNLFLPLFSGLFGLSSILFSFLHKVQIPKQNTTCTVTTPLLPCILGAFSGLFSGLLPGITCSVAASISQAFHRLGKEEFLVLIGGANTVYSFTAILAVFLINKPRSGAGILVQGFSDTNFLQVISFCLICVGVLGFFCLVFAGVFINVFNKVKYVNLFSFILIILISALLGFQSLLVLLCSTSLGLLCLCAKKPRRVLTATILFPAFLFYFV